MTGEIEEHHINSLFVKHEASLVISE